jgi:hypothetical protein
MRGIRGGVSASLDLSYQPSSPNLRRAWKYAQNAFQSMHGGTIS